MRALYYIIILYYYILLFFIGVMTLGPGAEGEKGQVTGRVILGLYKAAQAADASPSKVA